MSIWSRLDSLEVEKQWNEIMRRKNAEACFERSDRISIEVVKLKKDIELICEYLKVKIVDVEAIPTKRVIVNTKSK